MIAQRLNNLAALMGRLLLAMLFIAGAAQKINDPLPAIDLLTARGLSAVLIWPATVFNAVAGFVVLLGIWTRPAALLLALYCIATSVFHLIPSDPWQMTIFVKNWAIAGGCLMLFAHGPGSIALRPS